MIQSGLARRYAKALFLLAREEKREEEIGEEIARVADGYQNTPLSSVLNNPAFELEKRKKVLLEAAKGFRLSPIATRFLELLLERGRLPLLPSIFSHYRLLLDEAKGRVQARLATPIPLDGAILDKLRAAIGKISDKAVVLNVETDPSLIGGAVVEIEGRIYDGSVRTYLRKIQERLEEGS